MCMGLGLPAEHSTHQRSWFWAKIVSWSIAEASLTSSHTTPTPPTPWPRWQFTSRRTWSALAGLCLLSPATHSSPSSGRTWPRAWSWWQGTTAATYATSSCTCSLHRRESNLSTTWCPWSVLLPPLHCHCTILLLRAIKVKRSARLSKCYSILKVHVSTQPWTPAYRKLTSLRWSSNIFSSKS